MPNFDNWLITENFVIDETTRAIVEYNRILDKPSVIHINNRPAVDFDQTVRLEYNRYILDEDGQSATSVHLRLVIFGVLNHPTAPDNDFQSDDEFNYDGQTFRVEASYPTLGQIQAIAIKIN